MCPCKGTKGLALVPKHIDNFLGSGRSSCRGQWEGLHAASSSTWPQGTRMFDLTSLRIKRGSTPSLLPAPPHSGLLGSVGPGVPQGLKSGHTWHTVAFAVWKNQFCCKQWPKNAVMPELHHLYTQTPDLRDARDRQGNEIIDFSFSLLFILYFKESFHVNSS